MSFSHRLVSLFRNLAHREQAERELDTEVRAHLDLLTDEKLRGGLPSSAARRAALIELGGIEQVKAEVRDARCGVRLEQLWQDARFGPAHSMA
jgi:hypothetical protein